MARVDQKARELQPRAVEVAACGGLERQVERV
jgi:hypothetical protein